MRYQSIHLIAISYLFNNKGWVFHVGEAGVGKGPGTICFLLYFPFHKWPAFLISSPFSLFSKSFHIFCHFYLCLFFLTCLISGTYSEDILPISSEFHTPLNTHAHTHEIWVWTADCSSKSSPNDGSVFCPMCIKNVSNSGRNKCDRHALPAPLFTC